MNKEPKLILVDTLDNPRGEAYKMEAHTSPMLHRAFSVFLYDFENNKMLLQRRAVEKYHSGGLWSNSCCSHQRPEETLPQAVASRLLEELGIVADVEEIFQFSYFCRFREDLYEYEYDHVFLGSFSGAFDLNPEEASEAKWMTLEELERDLVQNPLIYSVWFLGAAPRAIAEIRRREQDKA